MKSQKHRNPNCKDKHADLSNMLLRAAIAACWMLQYFKLPSFTWTTPCKNRNFLLGWRRKFCYARLFAGCSCKLLAKYAINFLPFSSSAAELSSWNVHSIPTSHLLFAVNEHWAFIMFGLVTSKALGVEPHCVLASFTTCSAWCPFIVPTHVKACVRLWCAWYKAAAPSVAQFGRDWEFSWLARNLTPLKGQKIHWVSEPGSGSMPGESW